MNYPIKKSDTVLENKTHLPKSELKFWLAFSQITVIGPVRFSRLLDYFPNLQTAWQADFGQLCQAGLEYKIAEELLAKRKKVNPEEELEKLEKAKANLIIFTDPAYPKLLKEIYAPPFLLYYYGRLDLNNDFPLAAVGTRKMSGYGRQAAEQIVGELAGAGLTIVSGLALGIDTCAHQAALANRGKTIAVLGSGLDQIYPAQNRRLAKEIIESGGAVVSEFPLGLLPFKSNFPQRNRVISGLSLGTLVVEAGVKSGALITAQYALEQNREVFAVPGSIFCPSAEGPNQLLKLGAKLAGSATDILDALNLQRAKEFKTVKVAVPENETEKILLGFLADQPYYVDRLARAAKLDISSVNSALVVMEMKGLIRNLGGQTYVKAR